MREDGSRPQPWNESAPIDSSELFTFLESHEFYDSERVPQVDGHHLKDSNGKPTYMGLRSNQSTYEYVVDRTLYNKEGQIAFFNDPAAAPIDFPTSAMQIKSSWILLSDERFTQEKDQYHTVTLSDPKDDSTLHFALIGLHIMSKVQPNWFWTTFEHVRSNEVTTASMTVPISDSTQQINNEMKAKLEGTPWSYYQCRGSQWSFVNGADEPVLLSNTTIETRVQKTSSCMTCHSLASRGSRADNHLPMFRKSSSGLEGYVETPFWLQYCQDGTPTTQGDGTSRGEMFCSDVGLDYKYRAMDFVWIIRLAN